jgi:hypothetical protein
VNRSLRKWHFRVIAGLAPVAALTLVTSIRIRRTVPANRLPAFLQATAPADIREVDRRIVRGDGISIDLRRVTNPAGATFIQLRPLGESRPADLLVYLGHSGSDAFPGDSRLLGAVSGGQPATFALPSDSVAGPVELFLYSGATHTVLAHLKLTGSGEGAP